MASYAATAAATIVGIAGSVRDMFGTIESECVCRVSGNPYSRKRDLYFLACAVAFGKCPRLGPTLGFLPPPGLIMLNEDVTGREVEFTLQYRQSTAVTMTVAAMAGTEPATLYGQLEVLSGPKESVTGGKWNFTGPGFGIALAPAGGFGGPAPAKGFALVPDLPFKDRTVLTTADTVSDPDPSKAPGGAVIPTPNPRPPGDYRSRGTLVSLVYSALSNPGSSDAMLYPRPTVATRFVGG